MRSFESTGLWKSTLAARTATDDNSEVRDRLRSAYLGFRERAALLAAEIARDLPDYTVHDISHIDALWGLADLIAGPLAEFTPTEAFVLGGAFLIHDLGNALAAYPQGVKQLRACSAWQDAVALILRKTLGRAPKKSELDNLDSEVEHEATTGTLRRLHAEHAETLAMVSWNDPDSKERYHLIEDPFLREMFGRLIGRIAHSHWWPTNRLASEFPKQLGAPTGYPRDWVVDPLKLACLLRVSDAAHLESGRAPGFLKAARKPNSDSRKHWVFQQKLQQPILRGDRLVYTSAQPFAAGEADSWWLCFDALNVLNRELSEVDAILADCGRKQLAARGVQGAEQADRLANWIETDQWLSVDTRIRVSDVASLAAKLGGRNLYGDNGTVPLRELIQNGSDAVRARRYIEQRDSDWGDVTVRIGSDSGGYWVEVSDNGVGMSIPVITGPLLDFGNSFWESPLLTTELPGLATSGFEATGKFGIGFFSVFMWGERVQVITRSFKDAQRDTHVLEFTAGLESRPILRKAGPEEYRADGGTTVKIWVGQDPERYGGVLRTFRMTERDTAEGLCEWLCPALDANLYVQRGRAKAKLVVAASDWKTIPPLKLIRRVVDLADPEVRTTLPFRILGQQIPSNLRPLTDASGEIIGRIAIAPALGRPSVNSTGVVVSGGLRVCSLGGITGILCGRIVTAARDFAIPVVPNIDFAEWASEQEKLVANMSSDPEMLSECAATIWACGGKPENLPIARGSRGWISFADIKNLPRLPDEIHLVYGPDFLAVKRLGSVKLKGHVLLADPGWHGPLMSDAPHAMYLQWPPDPFRRALCDYPVSLAQLVLLALAERWSTSPEAVLAASPRWRRARPLKRVIGTIKGKPLRASVSILRNPNRSERSRH